MNEYEKHMGAAGDPAGMGNQPGDRERGPEEIQREIELTRERMSQNIDELGDRLSPQNLKRQAKEAITGKAQDMVTNVGYQARDTGSRVFDFIRDNPLPVAAVGLGAVWLIQQRNRSEISGDRMARFAYTGPERRREGITGRIADRASHLKESVGGAASSVAERAGELADTVRERAGDLGTSARQRASDLGTGARQRIGDLGSRAREQTRRARGGIQHTMNDNPLALVAGAAILGLAIGLLVPESEREDRFMGSTRDSLVDRAKTTATRVKDAAVEAGQDVREVVREEVQFRAPELKSAIKDVAQTVTAEVKEAAGRVKEQAKQAAKDRPV
jgi:ElaB/YqjD/DUF883 family membrane-anchored ribosome-binding protein